MEAFELAVGYPRVSTDEQALRGHSIPEQIDVISKYIETRGYKLATSIGFAGVLVTYVAGFFQEDYSGVYLDRPALDALRDAIVANGIKVVVVTELDRLARKAIYQALLEEELAQLGVRVEYVYENFTDDDEGRLFKGIKREIAEYERVKTKRRTNNGRRRAAKMGSIMSPYPPFGFQRVSENTPKGNRISLIPDSNERTILHMMKDLLFYGENGSGPWSTYKIAKRLTQMRVLTRGDTHIHNRRKFESGIWHANTVLQILKNEALAGVWCYGKKKVTSEDGRKRIVIDRPREEQIEVMIEPIFDRETFDRIQAQLQQNKERAPRNRKNTYALAGRVRCAKCRYTYFGSPQHGTTVYKCRGHHLLPIKVCDAPQMRCSLVDGVVWNWLYRLISNPELIHEAL